MQSTSQFWIQVSFILNRDYIAQTLCVNRTDTESGCKGACQLKKKLDQNREHQEKSGMDLKNKEITLFAQSFFVDWDNKQMILPEADFEYSRYYQNIAPQQFIASVFHPPAVA